MEHKKDKEQASCILGARLSDEAFGSPHAERSPFDVTLRILWCGKKLKGEAAQLSRSDHIVYGGREDAESSAWGALYGGNFREADVIYHELLKNIASKEGLKSRGLRQVANCYCCSLEAQGRSAEAQKIRNRLNVPMDFDNQYENKEGPAL